MLQLPTQAPTIAEMPERMRSPQALRCKLPSAGLWCAALVLLALLPRAATAWRQDVICRDGVYYIHLAQGLEARDWNRAFGSTGLNVYPASLAGLHVCGLDYPMAGKLLGLVLSSLTVLPLFGWVRRLFDDRVALTTAALYAAHPMLIEWSPALVRDPLFWFLFSFSLYALVRAVLEVRVAWFLVAGAATALAIHTRFEGWLLYLPWLAWCVQRWLSLVDRRSALAAGSLSGLFVYPALLLLVNLTWLHDCPNWQLGSFQRLQYVRWWWQGEVAQLHVPLTKTAFERREDGDSAAAIVANLEITAAAPLAYETASRAEFTLQYLDALRRGFDLTFGLLAGWGIWRWRALWRRVDYWALLIVATCIFGAIWIHFWYAGATSSRYVLTVLLLALPWTALGCLDLCGRFSRKISYARVWAGALCFLLLVGSVRAISHRDRGLEREAALGHWLNEHLALDTPIALTKTMPLCAYYGGDTRPITWLETRDAGWTGFLATQGLQLAIVEGNIVSHVELPPDWRVASLDQLPENCRTGNFTVLERVTSPDQTHAARTPGQGTLER